jgi:hypothetical protein
MTQPCFHLLLLAASVTIVACVKQAETPQPEDPDLSASTGSKPTGSAAKPAAQVTIKSINSAGPTRENPRRIGEALLSDGQRIAISAYLARKVPPKTSKKKQKKPVNPSVRWANKEFKFNKGVFMLKDPLGSGDAYLWGPPDGLVEVWNNLCPEAPFEKAYGFYGNGWYWGGVGNYGFHRYADEPPVIHSKDCPLSQTSSTQGGPTPPPPRKHEVLCQSDFECSHDEMCVGATDQTRGECRPRVRGT